MSIGVLLAWGQIQSESFSETADILLFDCGMDISDILHADLPFMYEHIHRKITAEAKSTSEFSIKLDSIDFYGHFQLKFFYNELGLSTLDHYTLTGYPNNGSKLEKVYNEENLVIERIESLLLYGEWVVQRKFVFAYDAGNNLQEKSIHTWYPEYQSFLNFRKENYYYNEAGGLTDRITSLKFLEWIKTEKVQYILDDENTILARIHFLWSDFQNIWIPKIQDAYTYNSAGAEIEMVQSIWNETDFIPSVKTEKAYNSEGNLISVEYFSYDMGNYWKQDVLSTFEYDDFGNEIEHMIYYWNSVSEEYISKFKTQNAFDHNYLSNTVMAPVPPDWNDLLKENSYNNIILSSTEYFMQMDEWNTHGPITYYYSAPDTNSPNDPSVDLNVYPNPFRETIRFSGSSELMQFTLFDIQGRMVLQEQVVGENEINMGNLPLGLYVYQLDGTDRRQVGKLVRE